MTLLALIVAWLIWGWTLWIVEIRKAFRWWVEGPEREWIYSQIICSSKASIAYRRSLQ